MNLFKLFSNARISAKVPKESVLVVLLEYMKAYQQNQLTLSKIDNIAAICNQYEAMKHAGLGSTANAKILKGIIQDAENYNIAQKFISDCRTFKIYLPDSFIISLEQFNKVVADYKLSINKLSNYTGIVPPEKVDYILSIGHTVVTNNYSFNNNYMSTNGLFIRNSKDRNLKEVKALEKYLKANPILKGFVSRYDSSVSYEYIKESNPEIPDIDYDLHIEVKTENLEKDDILIAAPKECFTEKFEVSIRPIDPIVFQYCKYGVIVHAVWGDEADSEILKRYKEFANNL